MAVLDLSSWVGHLHNSMSPACLVLLYALTAFCFAILGFRVWMFTIRPIFHPQEPEELPYWIPYLGSSLQQILLVRWAHGEQVMHSDLSTMVRELLQEGGNEYFGNTRKPFALHMGGEKLYFITSPEDVIALYKNSDSLQFDQVIRELSVTFGVSETAMSAVHQSPQNEREDFAAQAMGIANPQLKSLAVLNHDFWKSQLLPGANYDHLQTGFAKYIAAKLQPSQLNGAYVRERSSLGGVVVSSLKWTQHVLIEAALHVFFGSKILELGPTMIQDFLEFDEENWKLWYKWPKADAMQRAKSKLAAVIQRYLSLPDQDRNDASFIVQTMIKTQRAIGTSDRDLANILCMVVFVTNTNTWKVLFWCLSYLLTEPETLAKVHAETDATFQDSPDELPSLKMLMNGCPHLSAVFHESLRLCSASSSIRLVTQPATIGGKELPVGSRVIVPFRQLHLNPHVYGSDPTKFDPDRFIKQKSLVKSSSYRPFGGGVSYCPGRFIARQEVAVFIALLLRRFDVRLIDGQPFPKLDEKKPTTGLLDVLPGEDLLLDLNWKLKGGKMTG